MIFLSLILFCWFLFGNIISSYIPGSNYVDEFITILSIGLLFLKKNNLVEKRRTPEKMMLYMFGGVFFIGVLSTLCYHVQNNFSGVWRDMIAISKFPVCYYVLYTISSDKKNEQVLLNAEKIAKLYVVIISVCAVANLILKVSYWTVGYRYGLPMFNFFYTHSTFLVAACICAMAVLVSSDFKRNLFYIALSSLILLLTLRSKPIIVIVFLSMMYLYRIRGVKKIGNIRVIILGLLLFFVTIYFVQSRIKEYVEYADTAARGALYIRGVDIANDYFPLGSGFCTFASTLSNKYYSPLYYIYGIENVWGLTIDDGSYSADTFWPNIYAQYGYFGMFFYLFMLIAVFKSINKRFVMLSDKWIAASMMFLYIIAACFAEAFLTNDVAVSFAVVMALFLGEDNRKRKRC